MNLPVKRRGFRSIVVDSVSYSWKVLKNGTIVIRLDPNLGQLIINIDWEDPWLRKRENLPIHHLHPCSSPVTPKFMQMAIRQSNRLGWQPQTNHSQFDVQYRGGIFFLKF